MMRRMTICLIVLTVLASLCEVTAYADGQPLSYRGTPPDTETRPVREETGWGANPFATPLDKAAQDAEPHLTLSAIFYNPQRPSAIINERIVYKGNVIEGQKIVDIGKTHVILQWKGRNKRLDINAGPGPDKQGTVADETTDR